MNEQMTYDSWCREHNCDHGHCPEGCEHPQPFVYNSKLFCGRCWFKYHELTEMVPCTAEICEVKHE